MWPKFVQIVQKNKVGRKKNKQNVNRDRSAVKRGNHFKCHFLVE